MPILIIQAEILKQNGFEIVLFLGSRIKDNLQIYNWNVLNTKNEKINFHQINEYYEVVCLLGFLSFLDRGFLKLICL